ncbi:hypothetical protein PUN28_002667 [Cardiocondyla obscurior]|uniref:Uncharacterized protein n=1 Tax=Cardiocondyla obscurior TaxID=286306 RepID=A0AAW2GVQ4_9HYME
MTNDVQQRQTSQSSTSLVTLLYAHVVARASAPQRRGSRVYRFCQLSSVTSRQKSPTHEFLQRLLCKDNVGIVY